MTKMVPADKTAMQCLLRDPCYEFLFIVFLIRIVEFDVNDIYINEKAPSNKTTALRKSTNMGVWAVGILNQLFMRFLN